MLKMDAFLPLEYPLVFGCMIGVGIFAAEILFFPAMSRRRKIRDKLSYDNKMAVIRAENEEILEYLNKNSDPKRVNSYLKNFL